jgi:hypothetical protein
LILTVVVSLFFGHDFDGSSSLLSSFGVSSSLDFSYHFLIPRGDQFTKFELKRAHKVLKLKVLNLCGVINIININSKYLLHFKIVINFDFLNEFRIQIICNHLCLPESLLLAPIQLPKHNEWIRLGTWIQVWQVLAGEGQSYRLLQTTASQRGGQELISDAVGALTHGGCFEACHAYIFVSC